MSTDTLVSKNKQLGKKEVFQDPKEHRWGLGRPPCLFSIPSVLNFYLLSSLTFLSLKINSVSGGKKSQLLLESYI